MKSILLLVLMLAAWCRPAAAAGGIAAKEAIRTLARQRGASWLDRIVQVGGDRGIDQPAAWHIVAVDGAGVLREFFVSGKGILSEGPVPPSAVPLFQGPFIPQKKFSVDSTTAFMKANEAAKKAQVGFDSATYRLRSGQAGSPPVWTLQLNNTAGQKLADVTISASTGKVAQMATYNPAATPPPQQPSNGQQALDRTKEALNRGAASVGRGLNRAGGWIRRKFAPPPGQ